MDKVPSVAAEDWQAVLDERFAGDRELFNEIFELFKADANPLLGSLAEAVEAQSSCDAREAAHALKGVAGNFTLGEAFQLAKAIEDASEKDDLETARELLPLLRRSILQMIPQIEAFVGECDP